MVRALLLCVVGKHVRTEQERECEGGDDECDGTSGRDYER